MKKLLQIPSKFCVAIERNNIIHNYKKLVFKPQGKSCTMSPFMTMFHLPVGKTTFEFSNLNIGKLVFVGIHFPIEYCLLEILVKYAKP